jgi:hypothetical protein
VAFAVATCPHCSGRFRLVRLAAFAIPKSQWVENPQRTSPAEHFKLADAEFIVRNTMALAEYVGGLLG